MEQNIKSIELTYQIKNDINLNETEVIKLAGILAPNYPDYISRNEGKVLVFFDKEKRNYLSIVNDTIKMDYKIANSVDILSEGIKDLRAIIELLNFKLEDSLYSIDIEYLVQIDELLLCKFMEKYGNASKIFDYTMFSTSPTRTLFLVSSFEVNGFNFSIGIQPYTKDDKFNIHLQLSYFTEDLDKVDNAIKELCAIVGKTGEFVQKNAI